jgi:putative spermidine/putrescine transport system ATP-binding protein
MGYRNLLRSPADTRGNAVAVTVAGARITGTPMAPVGANAVVAIRPDDLVPDTEGQIAATVEIAEYHGRDFYCVGRGPDGADLYFRAPARVQPGETMRLTARPERVLVYPAEAA